MINQNNTSSTVVHCCQACVCVCVSDVKATILNGKIAFNTWNGRTWKHRQVRLQVNTNILWALFIIFSVVLRCCWGTRKEPAVCVLLWVAGRLLDPFFLFPLSNLYSSTAASPNRCDTTTRFTTVKRHICAEVKAFITAHSQGQTAREWLSSTSSNNHRRLSSSICVEATTLSAWRLG